MATVSEILTCHRGEFPGQYKLAALVINGGSPAVGLGPAFDPARVFVSGFDYGGGSESDRNAAAFASDAAVVFSPAVAGDEIAALRSSGAAGGGALVGAAVDGVLTGGRTLVWNIGPADVATAFSAGELTLRPPDIHSVVCGGTLPLGVSSFDVGIYVAAQFGPGGGAGTIMELSGPVVDPLTDNAACALTAGAALSTPRACLAASTVDPTRSAYYEYNFSRLTPQFAHGSACGFNVEPLATKAGPDVDAVIIGPGASADDFVEVAAFLANRNLHSDVRLWLAPASPRTFLEIIDNGALRSLIGAGGIPLPPGGVAWPVLLRGRRAATTSPRFFEYLLRVRHDVFLVGTAGAAAAVLGGHLTDPRAIC